MKIVVCIPARYASTRFPAKVLAKDTGKYLIQHTWEQARKAKLPGRVVIAADDEKIVAAAREFGAECVLTSPKHNSGTDRIAEAVGRSDADIVVNVQGDEPRIDPDHVDLVARLLVENPDAPMATLAAPFATREQIPDSNVVKVVVDASKKAIYFSRSVIPYDRDRAGVGDVGHYLRHLGIYAYRRDFLLKITALPQTPLEKLEKLEQLRAIENGYTILVGNVERTCEGIDTPEQYAAFVKQYGAKSSTDAELEINRVMKGWFDNTILQVQLRGRSLRQSDSIFVGILQYAKEYCDSALCLLLNNHTMAAAAILRILFELHVKLSWCLQAPDKGDESDSDNCFRRLRRWDYARAIEHKKVLQELREQDGGSQGAEIDETIRGLTRQITEYENQGLCEIPRVLRMCKDMSGDVNEDWAKTYPGIYRRFSREIHVDMNLIRQLVQVQGTQIVCLPEPPGYNQKELLSYCVVGGLCVNRAVRNYYDWDCTELQKECGDLVSKIEKDVI